MRNENENTVTQVFTFKEHRDERDPGLATLGASGRRRPEGTVTSAETITLPLSYHEAVAKVKEALKQKGFAPIADEAARLVGDALDELTADSGSR